MSSRFPIGVQLFNRPHCAQKVLGSLKAQNLEINQEDVTIVIDGFKGSSDERRELKNCTDEVFEISRTYFPNATILPKDQNLGIGKLHQFLQKNVFAMHPAMEWGIFIEEDSILKENYLEAMSQLISTVESNTQVVKVSTFQLLNYRELTTVSPGKAYAGRGTKAYAERASWFEDRSPLYETALEIMLDIKTSEITKFVELARLGLFMEYLQKDDLLDRILLSKGKIHLVYPSNLVTDIGQMGNTGFVEKEFSGLDAKINFETPEKISRITESQLSDILLQQDMYITENFTRIFEGYLKSRESPSVFSRFRALIRKALRITSASYKL